MKTLFTLAATALLTWSAAVACAAPPANVNFSAIRGLAFGLALDGRPLTWPVARQVHVDRLRPGQHWADFSLPTPYGPPLRFRTALWLEPGLETSYVLVVRPGYGPQLRQVSVVPLYGPRRGYGGSGYPPQAQPLPQPGRPYGGEQGGYYGGNPDGSYPAPTPYGGNQGGYGNSPAPAPAYPRGYGQGKEPAPSPDPNAGGYYPGPANGNYLRPLPPADVQDLAQALRDRPFDDARLPLVKQALAQGTVRADELAELIGILTFDKSRIDLAEYGYARVSDPQNFYRVYDALRYPSSVREVQQALGLAQGN